MTKKLLAFLLVCSWSSVSFASSPFLVSHSTVESAGGRAVVQTQTSKSKTLAESLVQLRHCNTTEHHDSKAADDKTTDLTTGEAS